MPKSLYDVHPGIPRVQKWIATLPKMTGRSLEEWVALVKKSGPAAPKDRRAWLQKTHKLPTMSAWWIADQSSEVNKEMSDPALYLVAAERYVADLYGGGRAALRPLHDALYKLCKSQGGDVRCCPCQTMVPFYRKHVFAQIKPSTLTRIDFGLALGATKAAGNLKDTGGYAKKDRITHRFEITSLKDINNAEVSRWVKRAYAMDA